MSAPSNFRTGSPFTFFRNGTDQFMPGTGTTIHFASKDADTLTLVGMSNGVISTGDSVTVKYKGATVFVGSVDRIVDSRARGDTRTHTITCSGPWGALSRLVYRQVWHATDTITYSSPRVVLNQKADGTRQNMTDTVKEICDFAASKCGYTTGPVGVDSIFLPLDETRDITCADAIRRELRFFPKKIVRFDYSTGTPTLVIGEPSTSTDASYVASVPKTQRTYDYNAHPVKGVDVYTGDVDTSVSGGEVTQKHQFHGADGVERDDIDVLHCYIPLEPGSSSASYETLDVVTEELWTVGGVRVSDAKWWQTKHPRLAGIDLSKITITEPGYTPPSWSPVRITSCTVGALKKFGKNAEVVRFHCKAKITTSDDVEDDIYLTMDFTCTDARTKTYSKQVGSSSTAGETLPEGLAQALYEQRAGSLQGERMTVRLGDSLPVLGDCADGLVLQEFDVDCVDLTADLHFGHPEYLSAEDMRSLLNGFRQRSYAENASIRGTGEPDEDGGNDVAGIAPVTSTEFQPGKKSKTTIKGDSGSIVLDSKKLESGETAKIREITIYDKDGNPSKLKVVGTEPKPGEAEDEPEEEPEDPHEQKDPHGESSNDPCNPSGDSSGDGSGGGGGAGASGSSSSVDGTESGVSGGAGVSAGEDSGGTSVPGCKCD